MSLEKMMTALANVSYAPRTLELALPEEMMKNLSTQARYFLSYAFGEKGLTILDLAGDKWKDDKEAVDVFFRGDDDERLEILAFLTLFVHEITHRIDFLISPFGLQYYANTLREYWMLQEVMPAMLDDHGVVQRMKFLAAFAENDQRAGWEELEGIIHTFYAWGDATGVKPLGKYIKDGWGDEIIGEADPFGVGRPLEPITVLKRFHTFRIPGGDRLWYLRPMTIFETKAVVNSLLFIMHVLGERGTAECLQYYERLYLERKDELPKDYFFLLDLGANIYDQPDFHSLLKTNHTMMIRSILLILSSICWFALQAPPPLKGEDPRFANPIFRLVLVFNFLSAFSRGRLKVAFNSTAEGMLMLDGSKNAEQLYVKSIDATLSDCVKVVDNVIELNQRRTWNPDVQKHFDRIFRMMRPHFAERDATYESWLGMPENGSPLFGCRTQDDWELIYDDIETPTAVKDWFSIRTDLFFNLLKPADEIVQRLRQHYAAHFVPHMCECKQGITTQWVSRFARVYALSCGFCGKTTKIPREEMHMIAVPGEN